MRIHLSRSIVAAVALTAATYAGGIVLASPADAAACSTADGVTVVVDFHGLGGGLQQVCDAEGGGKYATALFTANGFELTYVQKQPGFVCRIDAKPASDPCVNTPPTDAYWGLWWSDGAKATWSYSSLGAGSLKIPEGGSVAFSWNSGSGQDKPGANPPVHKSEPTPTPSPSSGGGGNGGNGGGNGGGNNGSNGGGPGPGADPSSTPATTSSAAPSQSAETSPPPKPTKSGKPDKSDEPTASASASIEPSTTESTDVEDLEGAEPTASAPAADDGGLPVWLAPVVVVLLFGAATAVAVVRRRRQSAGPPGP